MVRENPYNVIGLPAGPSEKDLARRRSMVKAYLAAGKELSFPEDIPLAASGLVRDQAAMDKAFAAIEQYPKRALHGLFWFMDAGRVDGPALNHLRAGDAAKAREIWGRVVESGALTDGTLSSALNLGALHLLRAERGGDEWDRDFLQGLSCYLKAFDHEAFPELVERISDPSVAKDITGLLGRWSEAFVGALQPSARQDTLFLEELSELLGSVSDDLRRVVASPFSAGFAKDIERQVAACAAKREADHGQALAPAWAMWKVVPELLVAYKALVGEDDLEFQHVSDGFAGEILQCCIEHFNHNDKKGRVDWDKVRHLMKQVGQHAYKRLLRDRIRQNAQILEENFDTREQRQRIREVEPLLEGIQMELQRADREGPSLEVARGLVDRCRPRLTKLKDALGADNELYLDVSSAVVDRAMQNMVALVNYAQQDGLQFTIQARLKKIVPVAMTITGELDKFDMVHDLRVSFDNNHRTLRSIAGSLPSTSSSNRLRPTSTPGSTSSSGSTRASSAPTGGSKGQGRVATPPASSQNGSDNSGCIVMAVIGVLVLIGLIAGC